MFKNKITYTKFLRTNGKLVKMFEVGAHKFIRVFLIL